MRDVVTGRPAAKPFTLKECAACGELVWPNNHCTACGAAFGGTKRRDACGCGWEFHHRDEDVRFCGDCGAPRAVGTGPDEG